MRSEPAGTGVGEQQPADLDAVAMIPPMDLATTLTTAGSIPQQCPVQVLAASDRSVVVQRITGGQVELCDRKNVRTADEMADNGDPAPF